MKIKLQIRRLNTISQQGVLTALLLTIKNVTEKVDRYEMIAVAADYHAELQGY